MIRAVVLTYFLTLIAGAASAGMPMPDTSSATILISENRKAVGKKTTSVYYYDVIKDYCERALTLDSLDVLENKNKISIEVALANWPNQLERNYGRDISSIMTDYSGAEASSIQYEQLVRFSFLIFPKLNKEDLLKLAAVLSRPFYVNQEDKDIFWATTSATASSLPYIRNEKDLLESILDGATLLKKFNVKPSEDVATVLKAAFSNQPDKALELIRAYDPYVDGLKGWCKWL